MELGKFSEKVTDSFRGQLENMPGVIGNISAIWGDAGLPGVGR